MRSFIVFAVTVVAVLAAPKTLPSNWPTCKRADPNLNECVRNAVHVAVADLSDKGAKDFGVFRIDPLIISAIDIDQGNGPVSIELHFTDLEIHGLKNAKLDSLSVDLDNFKFHAPVSVKEGVTLKGHYKINGKVLVLPITGSGPCDLRLENVTALVDLKGKETKKNNQKYMEVTSFEFGVETTRLRVKLENLFNGNKELSDQMNVFLNENWPEILGELKPAISQAFGSAFLEISNRIFSKVPFNKIFP